MTAKDVRCETLRRTAPNTVAQLELRPYPNLLAINQSYATCRRGAQWQLSRFCSAHPAAVNQHSSASLPDSTARPAGEVSIDGKAVDHPCRRQNATSRWYFSSMRCIRISVRENLAFALKIRRPRHDRNPYRRTRLSCSTSSRYWTANPKRSPVVNDNARRHGSRHRAETQIFLFDEPLSNLDANCAPRCESS